VSSGNDGEAAETLVAAQFYVRNSHYI